MQEAGPGFYPQYHIDNYGTYYNPALKVEGFDPTSFVGNDNIELTAIVVLLIIALLIMMLWRTESSHPGAGWWAMCTISSHPRAIYFSRICIKNPRLVKHRGWRWTISVNIVERESRSGGSFLLA